MVKKLHTLLMVGLMSSFACFAQQDSIKTEIQWVATQDGVGIEIPQTIIKSNDGNVFIMNSFESSARESDIMKNYSLTTDFWTYNMADGAKSSLKTCKGAPDTESANGSPNMTLYKVDKQGKLLWTLYTNIGDFAGGGVMAATPDNGVILYLKMRHTSKGQYRPDVLCQFVDDNGTETTVKWQCPDYKTYGWVYQPVLAKVNADGKVEWARHIEVEYKTAVVNGKTVAFSNNFEARAAVCDETGNIYLGGSYRTSINFGEKANLKHPRNVEGWDGDSQNVRGDIYVVKLNPQGEALWSTVTAGDSIECESMADMTYANKMLYIYGYLEGDTKSTVMFGNSKVTPVDHNNQYLAALSAEDGKFAWGKVYNIIKNKKAPKPRTKPMCITVDGDDLYLGGSFTGTIINEMDSTDVLLSCEDKMLYTYIIKSSAKDGAFKNGIKIAPGISEVQSIHVTDYNILASGYHLATSSLLFDLDKNLSEQSLKRHVIKNCPMGVTIGSVLIDDMLISATRGKNRIEIPGVDWVITPVEYDGQNNWACIFTGHKIINESEVKPEPPIDPDPDTPDNPDPDTPDNPDPDTPDNPDPDTPDNPDPDTPDNPDPDTPDNPDPDTPDNPDPSIPNGIESTSSNALNIQGHKGGLIITAEDTCQLHVYNIAGVLVHQTDITEGRTFLLLPKGIYVVNGQKVLVY